MRLGVEAAIADGELVRGDVQIGDGRVAALGLATSNGHGIAAPGFVDLQVNGFGGVDFLDADAEGYRRAGEALLETGVTSFLPTFVTAPEARIRAALSGLPAEAGGARVLGAHLEGPFISPSQLGVHSESDRCDPDVDLLDRLLDSGPVRLVTLAPELPRAHELVEHLLQRGIAVSYGHSDATAQQAEAAFDLGARAVTHVFNAMRPFHHREPGLAGAALARSDVVVQLILDGVHVAPMAAAIAWRAAAGRVALVTDAMAGAGLGDGEYRLGGVTVEVRDGIARDARGALAGSTLTMVEAVSNLHALGASLEASVGAATEVPARFLGLTTAGRLGVELPADIVVLNDELEVVRVLVAGRDRV